jgi:glycosyltransferase involved in cell wall biosynthesis
LYIGYLSDLGREWLSSARIPNYRESLSQKEYRQMSVLMITPHFPPDSSAGTHRVRLLAPHLDRFGWTPTVLTVDPAYYEGSLDPELRSLVPPDLRVEHARAIPAALSRMLRVGDLGLRSMFGLYSKASDLLSRERFDALYVTIYPTYPALLGPLLKRRFGIPFVLDYQDPWVGSWGKVVGAGRDGAIDTKSRLSRALAKRLEPRAVRAADALTAVSARTIEEILDRNPDVKGVPVCTIPIGGERNDFDRVRSKPGTNRFFTTGDGCFHLCYVGTLLPLGKDTLRALLMAVASIRTRRPELYRRLRLHFIGTSNERKPDAPHRVIQHALELGVADVVSEHPTRIDYLDALTVQVQASALLLMGSSEHHYTASKLYPALLAERPLLAIYHRLSSVSTILASHPGEHVRLVQFGDADDVTQHVDDIASQLITLVDRDSLQGVEYASHAEDSLSARNLAGMLAGVLDTVASAGARPR